MTNERLIELLERLRQYAEERYRGARVWDLRDQEEYDKQQQEINDLIAALQSGDVRLVSMEART